MTVTLLLHSQMSMGVDPEMAGYLQRQHKALCIVSGVIVLICYSNLYSYLIVNNTNFHSFSSSYCNYTQVETF